MEAACLKVLETEVEAEEFANGGGLDIRKYMQRLNLISATSMDIEGLAVPVGELRSTDEWGLDGGGGVLFNH